MSLKRFDEALTAYDKALSITPDSEGAWLGRGNAFSRLKRFDEAFAAYDKALSLKPDLESLEGSRLFMKMHLCNWEQLDKEIDDLTKSIRADKANCPPFALLSMNDLPDDHRRCAQAWVAAIYPMTAKSGQDKKTYKHDKIRLGYVSADLRRHPIGHLVAELFELHDKNDFLLLHSRLDVMIIQTCGGDWQAHSIVSSIAIHCRILMWRAQSLSLKLISLLI